jgi:hypothetical protein
MGRGRWIAQRVVALAMLFSAAGCSSDSSYCMSDADCGDSAKSQCQGVEHFCYEGCTKDADCTDTSKSWIEPGLTRCDAETSDCVEPVANGTACSADASCSSGHCTDGVCCDGGCSEKCKSCKVAGKVGSCSFIGSGEDPDSECTGETGCGGDVCDGAGACMAFLASGTVCATECSSAKPSSLMGGVCDGSGHCGLTTNETDCTPYLCAAAGSEAKCLEACTSHDDCVKESLCDRSEAHKTGKGTCADKDDVVKVGGSGGESTIQAGVTKAKSAGKKYIRVEAGSYTEAVVIDSTVIVAGVGDVTLHPGSTTGSEVFVKTSKSGVVATLQGLTLTGVTNTSVMAPIICTDSSNQPLVVVLDCTIKSNLVGLWAQKCDATLRRNIIQGNSLGGVALQKGTFTVESNLVMNNGTSGNSESAGGLYFDNATALTFFNNTVADNEGVSTVAKGVTCEGATSFTLSNSIFWNQKGLGGMEQVKGCSVSYSDLQSLTTPSGTANINKDPLLDGTTYKPSSSSPCIDAGSSTLAASVLDLAGKARPAGAGVDLGCYEVK